MEDSNDLDLDLTDNNTLLSKFTKRKAVTSVVSSLFPYKNIIITLLSPTQNAKNHTRLKAKGPEEILGNMIYDYLSTELHKGTETKGRESTSNLFDNLYKMLTTLSNIKSPVQKNSQTVESLKNEMLEILSWIDDNNQNEIVKNSQTAESLKNEMLEIVKNSQTAESLKNEMLEILSWMDDKERDNIDTLIRTNAKGDIISYLIQKCNDVIGFIRKEGKDKLIKGMSEFIKNNTTLNSYIDRIKSIKKELNGNTKKLNDSINNNEELSNNINFKEIQDAIDANKSDLQKLVEQCNTIMKDYANRIAYNKGDVVNNEEEVDIVDLGDIIKRQESAILREAQHRISNEVYSLRKHIILKKIEGITEDEGVKLSCIKEILLTKQLPIQYIEFANEMEETERNKFVNEAFNEIKNVLRKYIAQKDEKRTISEDELHNNAINLLCCAILSKNETDLPKAMRDIISCKKGVGDLIDDMKNISLEYIKLQNSNKTISEDELHNNAINLLCMDLVKLHNGMTLDDDLISRIPQKKPKKKNSQQDKNKTIINEKEFSENFLDIIKWNKNNEYLTKYEKQWLAKKEEQNSNQKKQLQQQNTSTFNNEQLHQKTQQLRRKKAHETKEPQNILDIRMASIYKMQSQLKKKIEQQREKIERKKQTDWKIEDDTVHPVTDIKTDNKQRQIQQKKVTQRVPLYQEQQKNKALYNKININQLPKPMKSNYTQQYTNSPFVNKNKNNMYHSKKNIAANINKQYKSL